MSRTDRERVDAAREHLRLLRLHVDRHDLSDDTVFDAVAMRLSAAIESIHAVDASVRDQVLGSTWPAMWSVRNRLAHGYAFVDRAIIEATVANDLGDFDQALDDLDAVLGPPSADPEA